MTAAAKKARHHAPRTRAIDIDCPNPKRTETVRLLGTDVEREVGCGAKAGQYCNGFGVGSDLCQARINLAGSITRAANRSARAARRRSS